MKKKTIEEQVIEEVELVENTTDVLPDPVVQKQRRPVGQQNPYVYKHIGNDVPWFEVLLLHPNPDLKSKDPDKFKKALRNREVVTKLFVTSDYVAACRVATNQARCSPGDYIPVSRAGWPPNSAWVASFMSTSLYVTVDENRLKPGPYRKATQDELLARCIEPHKVVFERGFTNGEALVIPQEPEAKSTISLHDRAKILMQRGVLKLAENV